jgi:hypothetical protein
VAIERRATTVGGHAGVPAGRQERLDLARDDRADRLDLGAGLRCAELVREVGEGDQG